jgi:2-polyprenyl-3-methyl-5-hydroxy-6-metoxy-1,4-benzoquinol methylase
MKIESLNQCRICNSGSLHRFLHLPLMPLTDDFLPRDRLGSEFLHDINVFVCDDCHTAQTLHDVDMGDYYEDYQYAVGASPTASRFMRILAQNLLSKFLPNMSGYKVIEVGSGDGGQLLAFQELGCNVMGYEPSSTLSRIAAEKGVPTIQGLFTKESIHELPAEWQRADVVMLSYTFDHLPHPREFVSAAKQTLDPEHGLLVVEIHNLQRIFERQEYCLFEHEHTIYLTEATAAALCEREGMTILDFDLLPEVDRRANSLIFVAAPTDSKLAKTYGPASVNTPDDFARVQFYDEQAALIQSGIANLDEFVSKITESGKTIAGYGAGGRGVMTLAAMNKAPKLLYLVDKKPKCNNFYVPKSGLRLVGLEALRDDPVDEIIVFSFGYMKEIQADLARFGYKPEQLHSLLDVLGGCA